MDRRTALVALAALPIAAGASSKLAAQSSENATIIAAAQTGQVLEGRTYYFTPPLALYDLPGLRGTPGLTILRPLGSFGASQKLIDIKTTQPGDISGLPRRSVFQDFRIIGNGNGYGIYVDGAMIRLERVDVIQCYHGVTMGWSVDVSLHDCILRGNTANVYIAGRVGAEATTTIRFRECQIREATYAGVMMSVGIGVTFADTIIESNAGYGMIVDPTVGSVNLDNVWFENNPTNVYDPAGRVSYSRVPVV